MMKVAAVLFFVDVSTGFRVVKTGGAGSEEDTSGRDGQYTPNQANWSKILQYQSQACPGGQDPKNLKLGDRQGNFYLVKQSIWDAAKWDGRTRYNPTQMARQDFYEAICPQRYLVRGLREVFERNRPFRDNRRPTKAEIDKWHTIGINHIRALVGYTESNRQVKPDVCLHARALWAEERRFTTKWTSKYPGDSNGSPPCAKNAGSHCGATFVPNATDQRAYLSHQRSVRGCKHEGGGAEGTFYTRSSETWSVKFARSFCSTLRSEGFWGGHTGPWFHREKFGFSFQDAGDQMDANWWVRGGTLRAKWNGQLMSNKWAGRNYRSRAASLDAADIQEDAHLEQTVETRETDAGSSLAVDADQEQSSNSCSRGRCEQRGSNGASCSGGYCKQQGAKKASCTGGYCEQAGASSSSCNGGYCKQRGAKDVTCNGGHCDQIGAKNAKCKGGFCKK